MNRRSDSPNLHWSRVARALRIASLAGASCCPLLATQAQASSGYQVAQHAVYAGTGGQGEVSATWRIADDGFRVDLVRGGDSRSLVYHGHVFYLCGRLSTAQITYVKGLGVADADLLASFASGVCQELGTDFSVRFFLSPYAALADADVGSGFGARDELDQPKTTASGVTKQIQGISCRELKHDYTLAPKDKTSGKPETVSETLCSAAAVPWRAAIGRELGMTLLRQVGGRRNMQVLSADLKAVDGLALGTTGAADGFSLGGKAFHRTYEVHTTAIKQEELTPADLGLPSGFRIIDLKTLAGLHAIKTVDGAAAGAGDALPAAMLRAFLLGANPLAGFIPQ